MFSNLTHCHEEYIQETFLGALKSDEIFVEYAKDSTQNKIHIENVVYQVYTDRDIRVRVDSYFDLYFIPAKQKYYFKTGFMKTQPTSAKQLYEIAMEKLQDPAYFSKKINFLKRKIKREKIAFDRKIEATVEYKKEYNANITALATTIVSGYLQRH